MKHFLRVAIGLILLATGIGKLLDVPGFMNVLRSYESFPYWSLPVIAVTFVIIELRLAEWLLVGKNLAGAALASTILHAMFTGWAALTLLRGIAVPNCGCFGVFLARPLTWSTVLEDFVMVAASFSSILWRMVAFLFALAVQIPAETEFKPFHEEDGVKVSITEPKEGKPWVRGVADIAHPAESVASLLSNFTGYREMLGDMVKKAQVLERGDTTARLHFVYPFPWFMSDRDAIVSYQYEKAKDGKFRLWWKNDAREGDPKKGKRIERVEGETRVDPKEKASRVTYTYYGELGGDFPEDSVKKAYQKEPVIYFKAIRKSLER